MAGYPVAADNVAKAFNDHVSSTNWSARPYLKPRASGIFNAAHFSYKSGLVSFVMDCDKPIGTGFLVKFRQDPAMFGDYLGAIQRGLCTIMLALKTAGLPVDIPADTTPGELLLTIRKDGSVIRVQAAREENAVPATNVDDLI